MSTAIRAVRHIVVGSLNPVKVQAARAVLQTIAPQAMVTGVSVESGVPAQPWGDEETIRGARARAIAARALESAELGIGIEGGVVANADGTIRTCAWAVIVDASGREGLGGSLVMPLPPRVAAMLRDGVELGHAMDAITGQTNVKHAAGAVGILTAGLVDRQQAYEILVSYALAPFVSAELWSAE